MYLQVWFLYRILCKQTAVQTLSHDLYAFTSVLKTTGITETSPGSIQPMGLWIGHEAKLTLYLRCSVVLKANLRFTLIWAAVLNIQTVRVTLLNAPLTEDWVAWGSEEIVKRQRQVHPTGFSLYSLTLVCVTLLLFLFTLLPRSSGDI